MLERRFVKGGQVRAKSGEPGLEGYSAVFNEQYDIGYFVETIKPGAFARALKDKQDVRCLFNHDSNNLLARSKSGTLALSEDSTGLFFSATTDPEMTIAADVQRMIARGDLDGCSFAFSVAKQTWREEKDDAGEMVLYRDIEDVDLYDVGPVTYPAYEGTSVKTRSKDGAAAASAELWPQGVPAEIRTRVPALHDAGKSGKPAAGQADDRPRGRRDLEGGDPCTCECPECEQGDCGDCSHEGCSCAGCSCASAESDRAWRNRAHVRIAIAQRRNRIRRK